MYHPRKHLALSLCLLPLLASCPSLGRTTQPAAPIDAEAVAPLWNTVLERYRALTVEHVNPLYQEAYLLDATLLQNILDAALNTK